MLVWEGTQLTVQSTGVNERSRIALRDIEVSRDAIIMVASVLTRFGLVPMPTSTGTAFRKLDMLYFGDMLVDVELALFSSCFWRVIFLKYRIRHSNHGDDQALQADLVVCVVRQ